MLPTFLEARHLDSTKRISQYIMHQYGVEEGLPSASLSTMTQCTREDLWIGTYSGLVRYDGARFNQYNIENTPELGSNAITAICERQHELWIGTHIGITKYKNHTFYRNHELSDLNRYIIENIFKDSKDNLWISTASNGLLKYDGKKITLIGGSKRLKTPIGTFTESADGRIWVGNATGSIYTVTSDRIFSKVSPSQIGAYPILMSSSKAQVWIASERGLFKMYSSGRVERIQGIKQADYVVEDSNGHLWVASRDGLFRYFPNSDGLDHFSVDKGFPRGDVLQMMFDHQGSLWVLTYRSGLLQFTDGIFTNYGASEGLNEGIVTSVVQIDSGRFWIGIEQGQIQEVQDGMATNWKLPAKLPNQRLKHLMRDKEGNVWVSTYGGLIKLDEEGRKVRYKHDDKIDDFTRLTFEDSKGNIWVATSRRGLYKLGVDGGLVHITSRDRLTSNFVLSIDEDSEGQIWVGTKNGVTIISDDKVVGQLQMQHGMPTNFVFDLQVDGPDMVWLTTELGLCFYNGESFQLIEFPSISGDVALFDLVEDVRGYLWLSSGSGLVYVNKGELLKKAQEPTHELHYRLFTRSDGMKSEQCVGAVKMLHDKGGRLWVPTILGMAVIRPAKVSYTPQLVKPSIGHVLTNDSLFYSDNGVLLPSGSGKRLVIKFSCYDFTSPEKNFFRYKLEPFEDEWQMLEDGYSVSYTNLPGKDYEFKLQTGDGIGNWSEIEALELKITPRFTETPFYYISIALGALLIGFLIHQSTQRVRKANERTLQKRVAERTREVMEQKQQIETQKEELEATLQNLKSTQTQLIHAEKMASLGQLTAGIAHEINNPVNFITGGVEALKETLREINEVLSLYYQFDDAQSEEEWKILQTKISKLKKELEYDELVNDARQMLEDVKYGAHRTAEIVLGLRNFSRSDESKFSPTNLHDCIDATLTILRNQYKNTIEVVKDYDPQLPLVNCKAGQINQVLMNLLANAVQAIKETGRIIIKTEESPDHYAQITISDNGVGIPEDVLSKIFDPFFTTKPIGKGTGLGLSISHGIIKDHQGEISVSSKLGRGTSFVIKLPLDEQLVGEEKVQDS